MIDCAYCDHPLICEGCGAPYVPPSPEHYQALSQPDVAIACTECGVILVCHWCKYRYDGLEGEEDEGSDSPRT
jgi:RNase P subunit RPR2